MSLMVLILQMIAPLVAPVGRAPLVAPAVAPVVLQPAVAPEPKEYSYAQVRDKAVQGDAPFVVIVGAQWCKSCQDTKRSLKPLLGLGTCVYLDWDDPVAQKIVKGNKIPQVVAYCPPTGRRWGVYRARAGAVTLSEAEGMLHQASHRAGWSPHGQVKAPVPDRLAAAPSEMKTVRTATATRTRYRARRRRRPG